MPKLEFNGYAMRDELAVLLEWIWKQEAPPNAVVPSFQGIAKDAQSNVRAAIMELERRLLLAGPTAPMEQQTGVGNEQETANMA